MRLMSFPRRAAALVAAMLSLAACNHDAAKPDVQLQPPPPRSAAASVIDSLATVTRLPPGQGDVAAADPVYAAALNRLDDFSLSSWVGSSGRSGTIRPAARFNGERGEICRLFDHDHLVAQKTYRGRGTACRHVSGVWALTANEWATETARPVIHNHFPSKTVETTKIIVVPGQAPSPQYPSAAPRQPAQSRSGGDFGEPSAATAPNRQGQIGNWKNLNRVLTE
jgi:hypothetical protein